MQDRRSIYLAFAGGIVFVDQFTKMLARHLLAGSGPQKVMGSDLLWFYYTENPGSAFGLTVLPPFMLATISIIASIVLSIYIFRKPANDDRNFIPLSLILGGASGNMIDRVVVGRVSDFISVDFPDFIFVRFPTFNIADSAISVGIVSLFIITALQDYRAYTIRKRNKLEDAEIEAH